MRQIPPQRAKVLAYIKAEIEAGREFPTRRAIADHMGWKYEASVMDVLHSLVWEGVLDRQRVKRGFVFKLKEEEPV